MSAPTVRHALDPINPICPSYEWCAGHYESELLAPGPESHSSGDETLTHYRDVALKIGHDAYPDREGEQWNVTATGDISVGYDGLEEVARMFEQFAEIVRLKARSL